jgi:Leucine-rich repeat (LRR) protein
MCCRLCNLYAYSIFTVALGLLTVVGCGSKPTTNTTEFSSEPGSSSDHISEEPAAMDPWQEAIRSVAKKESRSIIASQPIGGDQLNYLATASEAAELLLDHGIVDDAGLKIIVSHLPNLEHLRIRLSPITDEGAEALKGLSQLRVLNLPQSRVGSKSIQAWSKLSNLEHVRLGGSQLDDAAVAALAGLPNLQSLHLIGPAITEAGLQSLSKATKLSSLYVDDCPLSDSAWQQLKNSRPDLHVHLDQNHRDRVK